MDIFKSKKQTVVIFVVAICAGCLVLILTTTTHEEVPSETDDYITDYSECGNGYDQALEESGSFEGGAEALWAIRKSYNLDCGRGVDLVIKLDENILLVETFPINRGGVGWNGYRVDLEKGVAIQIDTNGLDSVPALSSSGRYMLILDGNTSNMIKVSPIEGLYAEGIYPPEDIYIRVYDLLLDEYVRDVRTDNSIAALTPGNFDSVHLSGEWIDDRTFVLYELGVDEKGRVMKVRDTKVGI